MKIIFNRDKVLTFILLNILFISYYLVNYNLGIWDEIADPIYYVKEARYISETFPLFERLGKLPIIVTIINAPHFLYILLLSYCNNIFKYPVFTLQYFLFISSLIQLYLLINFYNIKNKCITLIVIVISSGLIFWGSMPLKESLLANLYLLLFRFLFMHKNNNLFKFIYVVLVLFLISITRFWYPIFLLVNIFITFAIPNFIIVMRTFKLNKIYLILIPILSIITLNINDFLFRIRFNPLLIIKNIISPNPFNLIFNENFLYIPSAILFKFILLFSVLELFRNYKKILFNYQLSFLMFNYLLSVIALSDSVARGERHKFLALLSISIFYFVSKSIRSKENQTKKIN